MNIGERTFLILLMAFLFVMEMALGSQGVCMADEGWTMTGAQQIFRHPESVEYLFLYYNGILIGGVWELLFGNLGYIGYRLLNVLFMMATWGVIFYMLRPKLNRWMIALGFLLTALAHDYGVMSFDHNSLVVFLTVVSVCFLVKALQNNSRLWIMISGSVLAMNVFARIPTITTTSMILCLIPYYIFTRRAKATAMMLCYALLGFTTGVCIQVCMMLALGHWDLFVGNITAGISAATSSDSTHNLSDMFSIYLLQYMQIIKNILKIFALPSLAILAYNRFKNVNKSITFGLSGILMVAYFIYIFNAYVNMLYLYAFVTPLLVSVFFLKQRDKILTYLSVASLLILYLLPIGSDGGIGNMGENAIWLPLPLSLGILGKWLDSQGYMIKWYSRIWIALLLLVFVTNNTISISQNAYFDPGSRLEKVYRIDNPRATTFTTSEYARETTKVLKELDKYVREDDTLFVFQNKPLLHYLTKTVPWMYNPWVWTYDSPTMRYNINRAEERGGNLPVLVREKTELEVFTQYDPNWDNSHAIDDYVHKNEKIKIIQDFITRHGYSVVWESECFQILLPQSREIL